MCLKKLNRIWKKENNLFKRSSRKVTSFYSSLIAGLFVATSFIFINFFVPFGQENWKLNWFLFLIAIFLYCSVYYFIGEKIILEMNPREIRGYKKNFLASFIGAIYIAVIVLFKLKFWPVTISTIILSIVSIFICIQISHPKKRG